MTKNVGSLDRLIRLVISAILIALYFTDVISGALSIVALIVAAVFAATAFASSCPVYSILGASTCPIKKDENTPQ